MKLLLIITIFVASAMAQSQNTQLVNYLLEVQYASQSYYDSMAATFRDARSMLLDHLVELNTAGVVEVTEALRSITSISDESQTLIDNATGSEECLNNAITNWQSSLETAGSSISSCAGRVAHPIANATVDVHSFIVEQSRIAFEAQNLVLNVFAEVNPITNPTGFTPFIQDQIDRIYVRFNYETIPTLFKLLEVFTKLKETIPFYLHDCVNEATIRLNDEALVLRNTLELC